MQVVCTIGKVRSAQSVGQQSCQQSVKPMPSPVVAISQTAIEQYHLQCPSPSIRPIRTISIYQHTTVYNCLLSLTPDHTSHSIAQLGHSA